MSAAEVVPGVHVQACADPVCDGCYPKPPAPSKWSRQFPGPLRNDRGESRGEEWTRVNRELIARGVHPATRVALLVGCSETCATCLHHLPVHRGNTHAHKCQMHRLGPSRSAASDIRVSWPACRGYERDLA